MKSSEPKVVLNYQYSIAETCEFLGVHRESLRRYTRDGKIRCSFHRSNKRKFYLGSEILRFWKSKL